MFEDDRDVIIVRFPYGYELDVVCDFAKAVQETFPKYKILVLPEEIGLEFIKQENSFL